MMAENKILTKEELQSLKEWFAGRELPENLQLDKATYIPDLKDTLDRLFCQADICYENPKMQGCVQLLERIKDLLDANPS